MRVKYDLSLTVNGDRVEAQVRATTTLVNLLRYQLGLTGTKRGCEAGECGACTVLLDGEPVCACLVLALAAAGRSVTTIEGLSRGEELHEVQRAFVQCHGLQCGACTPGMVMSSVALLQQHPQPTEAEIREALHGNLCRCTGYHKIIESVQTAARRLSQGGEGA